ncbi:sialate O-acetylesterase [Paenibacillus beijingensis]|uniref:sialate O-acetylesterase n=1 Tax=Paenibacillus beijingensis TaxID=1126833 RepID=UPI0006991C28|nr:sialate O-acetylesterase [Paenibacillus beijingensis]
MEQPLIVTKEGKNEIPAAFFPNIRLYNVPKRPFEDAIVDGWHFIHTVSSQTRWEECTPEHAGYFSAVAFHFAKEINQELNVPIGIISCNWGGTSAACWMKEEYLTEDAGLNVYIDDYNKHLVNLNRDKYEEDFKRYQTELKQYAQKRKDESIHPDHIDEYLMDQSAGPLPLPPLGPKSSFRPSGLYYTMLKKVIPYTIKGVIWYQGESDSGRPVLYRKLFGNMIQNWRDDWDNPELPFLFVQLASFGSNLLKPDSWALLRESQSFVSKNVKITAMAVTIDCGDRSNIHPSGKRSVGVRLALLARNKIYGQEVECSGPVFRDMKVNENKMILRFDCSAEGLTSMGASLKGFEICGENGRFIAAKAVIIENAVEVCNDEIEFPVAVRYGWANYTDANLYNVFGLPASPFRTDSC